jgi:uridine kinase
MKGDVLVIHDGHRRAARGVFELLRDDVTTRDGVFAISVAGESGSGKSETASVLADLLNAAGRHCLILQQDDYFVHPPKTNEQMRRKDITHVGLAEVRHDLIEANLADIRAGRSTLVKPLVIFEEDRIEDERLAVADVDVVIVEGTYTTALQQIDARVFIDRTKVDTLESRKKRAREKQDEFLERVLEIEHAIISRHKNLADIIITRDYEAQKNDGQTSE